MGQSHKVTDKWATSHKGPHVDQTALLTETIGQLSIKTGIIGNKLFFIILSIIWGLKNVWGMFVLGLKTQFSYKWHVTFYLQLMDLK